MKSSIIITNKKNAYSLPKTQPTKNSSSQHLNYNMSNDTHHNFYQIQTCPEVSSFNLYDDKLYTHKINIDYGRLQQPFSWHKNQFNSKANFENINQQLKQTQRQLKKSTNNFYFNQTAHKPRNLMKLARSVQLINHKDEGSKNLKKSLCKKQDNSQIKNSSHKKLNPQISQTKKSLINLNNEHYPRLKQVIAAKKLQQFNENTNKNISQQTTYRNQINNQNIQEKQKTYRPTPHCRIVRSYVGGSKMQIKIISYPDNSQYMKLCGYKNEQKRQK